MFRSQSPIVWRQASCYLFEELLSPSHVNSLYQLGPNYLGSFQSPSEFDVSNSGNVPNQTGTTGMSSSGTGGSSAAAPGYTTSSAGLTSHISEEKIIFGLHAQKVFEMTLSKFRKGIGSRE